MASELRYQRHRVFCVAALAVWLSLGWPHLRALMTGTTMRGSPVPELWYWWLIPFTIFGLAVLGASILNLRRGLQWTLLFVQVAAVVAMAVLVPRSIVLIYLIIIAWQVAMATAPAKALSWVVFQTLAIVGALSQSESADLNYVVFLSFALQLFFVFTAQALRREAEAGRALAEKNRELQSAQAIIANTVRDAERLRISRELHDALGHELTALGLQLEIASHLTERGRANEHVMRARGLASELLGKVREVVSTLREADRPNLKHVLDGLARSVPTPEIHVDVSPALQLTRSQTHALIRCAQEAVTNAVRHADASNLWLQVTRDGGGVRLVARNDGSLRPGPISHGAGLLGMRERLEQLGGTLAVRKDDEGSFTVDAWLPLIEPQAA